MSRLENLRNLISEKFGGRQAAFAAAINRSPAQVNQWLTGVRRLGDGTCRVVESALGLPMGWMDSGEASREIEAAGRGAMWPFISVSQSEWESASDRTKGAIEGYARVLLDQEAQRIQESLGEKARRYA